MKAPLSRWCPALLGLSLGLSQALAAPAPPLAQPLQDALVIADAEHPGLADIYRKRGFKPFWIAAGQPTPRAAILRGILENAASEGLRPEDYRVEDIGRLWRKSDPGNQARLELLLSQGFLRYAQDLSQGRSTARRMEEPTRSPAATLSANLRKGLDAPDIDHFLKQQAPSHAYYQALKQALQTYRAIAQNGGWPTIPPGRSLQPGMSDPRIPLIRQRLAITDQASPSASPRYDDTLAAAVRHFQRRHNLPDAAIIGPETLAAMNVPVAHRIRQIELNMERWRWLTVDSAGRHLWVNIPSFALTGLNEGHVELSMAVVVGKLDQQTPSFEDRMEYLEFNPDWRVPADIFVNEYLPQLRKNPASLLEKHIRLFESGAKNALELDPRGIDWQNIEPAALGRYMLRQDPGPWNALGTVKFMFPNKYNVYLHDTTEPRFFAKQRRTYSHGCVRVSRPYELAAWVLGQETPPWTPEKIQTTIASGQHVNVPLTKPLPVHLVYRTALVGEDNDVYFPQDIYNRDAALEKALFGG